MNNNKHAPRSAARSRWLPLALALAVSASIGNSYADSPPTAIHIQAQPLAQAHWKL